MSRGKKDYLNRAVLQSDAVSSLLSVLGLGLLWSWTFTFSQSSLWIVPEDGPVPLAIYGVTNTFWLAVVLFLLSRFSNRLAGRGARIGILVAAGISCSITIILYLLFSVESRTVVGGLSVGFLGVVPSLTVSPVMTPLVSLCVSLSVGASWALLLAAWAQSGIARDPLGSFRRISLSMMMAGLIYLLGSFDVLPRLLALFVFPCAALLCFAALGFLHAPPEKELAIRRPTTSLRLYAAVIGFAWGALSYAVMPVTSMDSALGGIIAGVLLLLLVLLLREDFNIEICVAIIAVLVCTFLLVELVFPLEVTHSSYFLGACFQGCFMLVLVIASFVGMSQEQRAPAIMCLDIALFVLPIAVGAALSVLLAGSPQVNLWITAALLLLVIGLVVVNRKALTLRQAFGLVVRAVEPEPGTDESLVRTCQALAERYGLTSREMEVLIQLGKGNTLAHIAQTMHLSENTLKGHRGNLYAKLGIHKRQELLNVLAKGKTDVNGSGSADPSS